MYKFVFLLLTTVVGVTAGVPDYDTIAASIRSNDMAALRPMLDSPASTNVANGLKLTPLHYAALYGSTEAIELLLKRGADVNAVNQSGATPLVLGAWSFERTRLLVEHGASVNVAAKNGITSLLVAAAGQGNSRTVAYLLDHGADIKATNEDGEDALIRAAFSGDAATLKILLDHGADPKRADKFGFTALQNALTSPDSKRIEMLLKAGADVNSFNTFAGMVKNGPIALTHMTPLMLAAPFSDQATISMILSSGAHVNYKDVRGMSAVMLAIATDHAQPATVRKLVEAGADLQAKDIYDQTPLDWANKYSNPEILSILVAAGAKAGGPDSTPATPNDTAAGNVDGAIERALTLFTKSNFFQAGGGCVGCHHQAAFARSFAAARTASLSPAPQLRKMFFDGMIAIKPRLTPPMQYLSAFGGDLDVALAIMASEAELNEPANSFTDLVTHFIALRQDPSGAWISDGVSRSPLEEGSISKTSYGIVALKHHGWAARQDEFETRIRNAKVWLSSAKPETTYEHADRIMGLREAGVPVSQLRSDAKRLLALQREDGGWAQTPYLESDAYGTGLVLDRLFKAGLIDSHDSSHQRGVAFLLHTQYPDGSWYVRSRAPKFQPYFQSGFPFNHDQWISSAGTSWAVMALSHAAEPVNVARN